MRATNAELRAKIERLQTTIHSLNAQVAEQARLIQIYEQRIEEEEEEKHACARH